jgi:1,4-dihydroxy-2-naphthoyl-CoA hydrolase
VFTAEQIRDAAPLTATLGISFAVLERSEVRAILPFDVSLSTIGGGLHGGVLMSVADIAATVCAMLNLPDGTLAPTAESTTYFLRPVMGSATAVARPLRVGRRTAVIEVDVFDDAERQCGRTMQMHSVMSESA